MWAFDAISIGEKVARPTWVGPGCVAAPAPPVQTLGQRGQASWPSDVGGPEKRQANSMGFAVEDCSRVTIMDHDGTKAR